MKPTDQIHSPTLLGVEAAVEAMEGLVIGVEEANGIMATLEMETVANHGIIAMGGIGTMVTGDIGAMVMEATRAMGINPMEFPGNLSHQLW